MADTSSPRARGTDPILAICLVVIGFGLINWTVHRDEEKTVPTPTATQAAPILEKAKPPPA